MSEEYDQDYWQNCIDNIMDCFDFDKVSKVMTALDWQWASCKCVPSIYEIKREARSLLKSAIKRKEGTACGGFWVYYNEESGLLRLMFVVDSWDGCD